MLSPKMEQLIENYRGIGILDKQPEAYIIFSRLFSQNVNFSKIANMKFSIPTSSRLSADESRYAFIMLLDPYVA